tara:strand:- start:190 stop:993 length:804 start_codon:yes stop_codon:yes gene_type:complete
MKKLKNLFITLFIYFLYTQNNANAKLLSFQSEYDISLAKIDSPRVPGKTYVDKASGYLLIDWINNCNESWLTTQRMMTRFVNSHGVGTVSEINYSLNEMSDGKKMEFVLEVKEDAEVVERHYGKAERNKNLSIKFEQSDKEYNFSKDVIFPHKFLEDVIDNLEVGKKLLVRNVYEGTIPDKFFNISVFFTDEVVSVEKKKLDNGVINKFKKIRMAYYQDKIQTPIFEQTVHLNEQGIASFFRYDYPDYSLELNLKEVKLSPLDCKNR